MTDLINHQTKYAQEVYSNGFITDNYLLELKLLAIYMRDVLQYKPKKREAELKVFCREHINDFKEIRDYRYIKQSLNYSKDKKHKLIDFDDINIYQTELSFIDNLNVSHNSKKVLLALLVEHKKSEKRFKTVFNDEYKNNWWGGNSVKYNYLKKISNIPSNCNINCEIFNELIREHIITNAIHGMVILDFLNHIVSDGEVVYNITDFDNVGWYYDLYTNKNRVGQCKECGKLFKRKTNNQIYCEECAESIHKEQKRVWANNHRIQGV